MALDDLKVLKERLLQQFPLGSQHTIVVHELGIGNYGEYIKVHGNLPLEFGGKKVEVCYDQPASLAYHFSGAEFRLGSQHQVFIHSGGCDKREDSLRLHVYGSFHGEVIYERNPSNKPK
ncbi:MAG TPA: hypothetical protein VJB13_04670 [Candidatus Nanoarchaeia archaeon]|nr:hypothetical protein [Candidatus Nanoarchaeia archaeon]